MTSASSELPRYTRKEVAEHKCENDAWIVLNGEVYDVTRWLSRHPGGAKVLLHYAGEDATVSANCELMQHARLQCMHAQHTINAPLRGVNGSCPLRSPSAEVEIQINVAIHSCRLLLSRFTITKRWFASTFHRSTLESCMRRRERYCSHSLPMLISVHVHSSFLA